MNSSREIYDVHSSSCSIFENGGKVDKNIKDNFNFRCLVAHTFIPSVKASSEIKTFALFLTKVVFSLPQAAR